MSGSRRRAVVVSPDPHNRAGGTELFCSQVAGLLERLGVQVTVVGPNGAPPQWMGRTGGGTLWLARSVRRRVHDSGPRPDLVVTAGHLGWPGRWGGQRVHVYVGNLVRQARHLGGNWHWRMRWGAGGGLAEAMSAWGATVVAISEQAAQDAARLYLARVTAVLSPGVDTELFRPRDQQEARRRLGLPARGRFALFVGRGEPGKGPDVAMAAARRAGFDLLAAGTRPVNGSRALGVLTREQMAWAYAAADAVVLPTHYEGFGYVAVEAVAAGVPLVTTPTGWARELGQAVPQFRPFLTVPEPEAVAEALARTASAEGAEAAAAARRYVLDNNSMPAFDRRWTSLFVRMGVVG